jgi:hypothetical protein
MCPGGLVSDFGSRYMSGRSHFGVWMDLVETLCLMLCLDEPANGTFSKF